MAPQLHDWLRYCVCSLLVTMLTCTQDDQDAVRVARSILRKDPEFLDIRCALAAFLWATGDAAQAEAEWSKLQAAQGT
jgi:hypothetical protein